MDIFGIGTALTAVFEVYKHSARQTGRTSHLVNHVRDGDTVIFSDNNHLNHFKKELNVKRGRIDINLIVCSIERDGDLDLRNVKPTQGQVFFDHEFIELYHQASIQWSINNLNKLSSHYSGAKRPERVMKNKWNYKS